MTARRYYKATRRVGTDFHTGTVDYGAALTSGDVVTHPAFDRHGGASSYLSVATVATDCTGFRWPCRLFAVEAVGRAWQVGDDLPNKRAVRGLRVVEELPAWQAFGPQGAAVAALIDRARALTSAELEAFRAWYAAGGDAAWDAAGYVAWDAAGNAAWDAARNVAWDAAGNAAWDAARDAAWALVARDLITAEHYATLTAPWAAVIGPAHPEDAA
jgi:hypothetical protein